jgi:Flp pilus assembly protein TadG
MRESNPNPTAGENAMTSAAARRTRRRRRSRGATLLEFAVTVPLFVTLLIGMVEYAYYFYVAISATSAAREGARQCTLVSLGACGDCEPSAAGEYMSAIGLEDFTTATASCQNTGGTIMYTVDVLVDFPTLTGFMTTVGAIPESPTEDGYTRTQGVAVMRGQ